ncbi:MAG TPA: ATP-binding protein, partial [Sphingorhabdus sp.]|nr:ATP-binding protein [Sphingorhabdus sp.]
MSVVIERSLLDDLFPANIFLDHDVRLSSISSSIRTHFPDIELGMELFHYFDLPGGNDHGYFQSQQGELKLVHLTSKCSSYKLAGTSVPQEDGYFLALHHVPTEKAFKENRFQISEFPPGDPRVQGLMLINLQRALIEESQDTALELAFERQRSVELLGRVSRIAGYMAHDFNNFLSIIKLNCDRLTREFGDNERLERLVSIIRETAARGSSITGSLMKLSHQRTDTLMPLAINKLIEDNIAFLRTVVGSNVTLTVNLDGGEAQSVVSHVRLLNCLTNLLINSRDAMPNGGEITISTGVRMAALDGGKRDPSTPMREYFAIEVADNGKGMTEAVLSRAFEPLFSTKSNGSGFGLASALEFAREMGGDACLDSAPGKGAKVYLYFPTVSQTLSE